MESLFEEDCSILGTVEDTESRSINGSLELGEGKIGVVAMNKREKRFAVTGQRCQNIPEDPFHSPTNSQPTAYAPEAA